ncbi:MAG: alpha-amylase family glycosyl hydrolase, partial [Bacteroidia bacterium]
LPNDALGKSYLRVWYCDSQAVSNDVMVPLYDGKVMDHASKISDRHDPRQQIMYNPMIDRFVDGNKANNRPLNHPEVNPKVDYFGGDLAGLTAKIKEGYFHRLGINTLWISPIVRNPQTPWGRWPKSPNTRFSGYHAYWPVALTETDERFCTPDELRTFIQVAHENNLNVVLDYVAHHVHVEHPLYKEHPDWFTSLYLPDGSKNTERWDDQRLTTWFDDHMPSFNYFKPEVVEQMSDSALWWFQHFDIDGFRHDAAKHVPTPFWRALTYKVNSQVVGPSKGDKLPERVIYKIGETYGSPELIGSYLGTGLFQAQFDFN